MSEQKNNGSSMNFEMGNTLEDIFGAAAAPQVDLGMPPAAQMQATQPQASPVTNPPAAAPEGQPAKVQQLANQQAVSVPAPQPVQQTPVQPQPPAIQNAPDSVARAIASAMTSEP